MIRRLGVIAMLIAFIGALSSLSLRSPAHLALFGLAMIVILVIVGGAENDRNHSS